MNIQRSIIDAHIRALYQLNFMYIYKSSAQRWEFSRNIENNNIHTYFNQDPQIKRYIG